MIFSSLFLSSVIFLNLHFKKEIQLNFSPMKLNRTIVPYSNSSAQSCQESKRGSLRESIGPFLRDSIC